MWEENQNDVSPSPSALRDEHALHPYLKLNYGAGEDIGGLRRRQEGRKGRGSQCSLSISHVPNTVLAMRDMALDSDAVFVVLELAV